MTLVELYTTDGCPNCEEARDVLARLKSEIPFALRETKVTRGEGMFDEYESELPVVFINKRFSFKRRLYENLVRIRLQQIQTDSHPPSVRDEAEDSGIVT